ncbi:MAG: hypothetical protein FJX54_08990 [Alphaproteobacteria bacterium]|nr:hypothetical protein [Alphaproteobacteria bacterium]
MAGRPGTRERGMDAKVSNHPATTSVWRGLRDAQPMPSLDDLLKHAIDRLAQAVLVVDTDSEIITRNAMAERILASGDGLCVRGHALSAVRAADARALKSAIAEAIAGPARGDRSPHEVVTIGRPSAGTPLILLIAALETGPGRKVALVLVGDLERPTPSYGCQLRVGFGLTDSEIGVALALMDGQRPKEIADRRGVRLSTVSTQMKAIFAKTGAARQSDLVKLIAGLPSLCH